MIPVQETLRGVVAHLDAISIPYMVVGSLASSAHGIVRTTYDADIVIAPSPEQLNTLIQRMKPGFYLNVDTARQAFAAKSMFNAIDLKNGCKADLIFLKDQSFDRSEFGRRLKMTVENCEIWAASAEDTILAKLKWSQLGDSQRQFRDAFDIAQVQQSSLDRVYLNKWGVELGVEQLLNRLFNEAGLDTDSAAP